MSKLHRPTIPNIPEQSESLLEDIDTNLDPISALYESVRASHQLFHLGLHKETEAKKLKLPNIKLPNICLNKQSSEIELTGSSKKRMTKTRTKSRRSRILSIGMHSYKVRRDKFSQFYSKIINHRVYKLVSILVSFFALYIRDLSYAFNMPQESDLFILDITLSIVFFFIALELILYSLTHSNYMFTFFFWMDLIGTLSLLMDIPWIMLGFGLNDNIFLIVKGGKTGRAAKGATSIKMMRMVKLTRIIGLFRKKKGDEKNHSQKAEEQKKDFSTLRPTKMGSFLADRVTQKVILGILLSFLILPLFDVSPVETGDKTFIGLEHLEHAFIENNDKMYNYSLSMFEDFHSDILFLQVSNRTECDYLSKISLRSIETTKFVSKSGQSNVVLDDRKNVQMESVLNLALTTFIMMVFGIGAFVIASDAFILVYPIEYLLATLHRLCSIATEQNHESNVSDDELMRSIQRSMTDIFYSGKRQKHFIQSLAGDQSIESSPTAKTHYRSISAVERVSIAIIKKSGK